MEEKVNESVAYIKSKIGDFNADTAIVIGSGYGDFASELECEFALSYAEIPNFLSTSIEGHLGIMMFGKIKNKNIILLNGRVHFYEGYPLPKIVFPYYVLQKLGVKNVILTNAVGAVNPNYNVNDFVAVTDHINLTCDNPLRGFEYRYTGETFPSLKDLYNRDIIEKLEEIANKHNIPLHKGVLVQTMGRSFETPAEIKFYATIGADIVGMSSVIEAIACVHCGMKVGILSLVTNKACGIDDSSPSHQEVIDSGHISQENYVILLSELIENL